VTSPHSPSRTRRGSLPSGAPRPATWTRERTARRSQRRDVRRRLTLRWGRSRRRPAAQTGGSGGGHSVVAAPGSSPQSTSSLPQSDHPGE
jgi:hypothetical protein